MKICWDNLEGLIFTKNGNFKKGSHTYYIKKCERCSEDFLGTKKSQYCSYSCSSVTKNTGKSLSKEHKKKISESLKGKKRILSDDTKKKLKKMYNGKTFEDLYGKEKADEIKRKMSISARKREKRFCSEKTKRKLSVSRRKENGSNWKGGYYSRGIPTYDTYAHQIDWIEECRRNKEDSNVLEVKCTYCGRWFVPEIWNVYNRIKYLQGKYLSEYKFYCSDSCKKECPIYGKHAELLMREDAIRAGRLNWIELNREVQPELRQLVLKRDNYTCQKCGSIEHLHCHHILPVSIEPIESADVDNCITYCKECHKKAHMKDGCRYGQLRIC